MWVIRHIWKSLWDTQNTSRCFSFFPERGRVYCDAQRQKISVTQQNFISERMFLTADDVTVQIGFARAKDSEWNCRILTNNGNSKCFQTRFDAAATWHTAKSLYVGLFSVPSPRSLPPTPHPRIVLSQCDYNCCRDELSFDKRGKKG